MLGEPRRYRNLLWPKEPNDVPQVNAMEEDDEVIVIEDNEEFAENEGGEILAKVENIEQMEYVNDEEEEVEEEEDNNEVEFVHISTREIKEANIKVENWLKKCKFHGDFSSVHSESRMLNKDSDNGSECSDFSRYKRKAVNDAKEHVKQEGDELPLWPEQLTAGNGSPVQTSLIICGSSSAFKDRKKNETLPWEQLYEKEKIDVNITNFCSSEEFFVELADDSGRQKLRRRLKKATLLPLDSIHPGDHCLIERDGEIHRAMVHFHNPLSSMCYSVDTGEIFYFNQEEPPIYKMPSKIRKALPFQAIRCKFFGLHIRNNSKWLSYIQSKVLCKIKKPRIYIAKIHETSEDNTDPMKAMDGHDVILYDGEGNRNINSLLIELQLAKGNLDIPIVHR